MREEMRKFAIDKVLPHAHEWHLQNEYIPLDVIAEMSAMGVFGLTIPESYGGLGAVRTPLDKAMLDYLRKFYQFGWTWRELLRDLIAAIPEADVIIHMDPV